MSRRRRVDSTGHCLAAGRRRRQRLRGSGRDRGRPGGPDATGIRRTAGLGRHGAHPRRRWHVDRKRRGGRRRTAHRGDRRRRRARGALSRRPYLEGRGRRRHARADQQPYPRADDALSRPGRRPRAHGVAGRPYLPRRGRARGRGIRALGYPPGVSRDDPRRHHHLRRHVLLRARDRRRDGGLRPAGDRRREPDRLPGTRQQDLGRGGGLRATLRRRLARSRADHAGDRSPRHLHRLHRAPDRGPPAGHRARRAAPDPPRRSDRGSREEPRKLRQAAGRVRRQSRHPRRPGDRRPHDLARRERDPHPGRARRRGSPIARSPT